MHSRVLLGALCFLLTFGVIACGSDDEPQNTSADVTPGDTRSGDILFSEDTSAEDTSPSDTSAEDTSPSDTSAEDTGPSDTSAEDTGPSDTSAEDAGLGDVTPTETFPLEGFGGITGDCDVLDDELLSPNSFLIMNILDFGTDRYDHPSELDLLSTGGQRIVTGDNAGGSSIYSETFSYELLYRCEGAELLKLENEILYAFEGKITDYLALIDGEKVGVSVTRGFGHPSAPPYSLSTAQDLLDRKLAGVIESSQNVSDEDRWVKQILHILTYTELEEGLMAEAYQLTTPELRSNTIVLISRTDGDDDFVYLENP